MDLELITIARVPKTIEHSALWARDHSCKLNLLNLGVRDFTLADGLTLSFATPDPGNLILYINKAVQLLKSSFFFLVDDFSISQLKDLEFLFETARTIPRLASLTSSPQYGLNRVRYNPLFGTLYQQKIFSRISCWNPELDLSTASFQWSEEVSNSGWVHMTAYIQQYHLLLPDHSGRNLEISRSPE